MRELFVAFLGRLIIAAVAAAPAWLGNTYLGTGTTLVLVTMSFGIWLLDLDESAKSNAREVAKLRAELDLVKRLLSIQSANEERVVTERKPELAVDKA